MRELIKLGGRNYALCQHTTLRQDSWVQGLMSQAGVLAIEKRAGENYLEFATRITATTVESGLATRIIAGLIEDIDAPPAPTWTPEYATAIAEKLDALTDPQEKERFRAQLGSLVAGFFASAMKQLLRSRSYSERPSESASALPPAAAGSPNPSTPNAVH